MSLAEFVQSSGYLYCCYFAIGVASVLGSLAIVSPKRFEQLCTNGRRWVDTPLRLKRLDEYLVDTDALAMKNTRLTGVIFLTMSMILAIASGIL